MRYERPETIQDAAALLAAANDPAYVLAGGTDLLVRMQSDAFSADLIVDIKFIAGMDDVTETEDAFVIGAAVPCAALSEHTALAAAWPGVVEAANLIGSTQIQGRCTMSGNLCNASPAADSACAGRGGCPGKDRRAEWHPRGSGSRYSDRSGQDVAGQR